MGSAGSTSHAFLKTPCFQLSVLPNIGFQLSVARRPSLVARRSSPVARRSSLVARRPSLVARRSSLVARRSSLVARRSSLVARPSSLVARRRSSLVARRLFENSNLTAKKNVTCIRITPGQALS
jgi:hypothetical protein